MKIRPATRSDATILAGMQADLADEGILKGYQPDSAGQWSARDMQHTFLACDGKEPVGFIYSAPRPFEGECVFPKDARIIELVELYVCPEYRRVGLGRKLVKAAELDARQSGFTHLRVYSSSCHFDAIVSFYRSCGFDPWYVEMTRSLS